MSVCVSLLLCLTISAQAITEQRPLSMKDVSLMLRSGYSSETVLRELAKRGVLDSLDDKTRATLLDFGATPPLMDALTSGKFGVSAQAAARANAAAAAATAAQEKETEKILRAATSTLQEQRARARSEAAAISPVMQQLAGKLVSLREDKIEPLETSADSVRKSLIAIYFSAHWCAPCRKFTPTLVDFYNRVAAQHPEFELVFYSFDHSRENWEQYMLEEKMPWPAIDYDERASFSELEKLCGDGIPSLVLLDGHGQLLSDSYEHGRYAGPQKVVAELEKRFGNQPNEPVVQTQ